MKFIHLLIIFCFAVIFESVYSDSVAFVKIGSYQGKDENNKPYKKSYYLPRNFQQHNWFEASLVCKLFDMKLATFDTLAEFNKVQSLLLQNLNLITSWVFIGGITSTPRSTTEWYWAETNKKISFKMTFDTNQPDFYQNNEWCLSLGHRGALHMNFNDLICYFPANFLCDQRE